MDLAKQKCKPCEAGIAPMDEALAKEHLKKLQPSWQLSEDIKSITRELVMQDFADAMQFINSVAAIAEEQGHHPDITLYAYKKVCITLATHAINGLSLNDFIVASKIDAIKKS